MVHADDGSSKGDGKAVPKSERWAKAAGSGDANGKAKEKMTPVPRDTAKKAATAAAPPPTIPPKLTGASVSGDATGGTANVVEPGLVAPKFVIPPASGLAAGGGVKTAGVVPNSAEAMPGAMSDASKRLRGVENPAYDEDDDGGFEMPGSPPTLPSSPNFMLMSMQWSSTWKVGYSRGDRNAPLPAGLSPYPDWTGAKR